MTSKVDWTPSVTGVHVLRAKYVGGNYTPVSEGTLSVSVGAGVNTGTACLPLG
ncbi:hypothetical protein LTV02_28915 [Nocardia yamanashiensis]|uniref:hypothetical protein n=1 Tax=Nocardia yamanashiensis TaxID=209247 RepID=UPI001E3E3A69|nr:hypothetical protein [Nocardia yamanashiensis]UGT40034.1 hypothetical protein LTV02_28915 [Nocardia yamanashiensis]